MYLFAVSAKMGYYWLRSERVEERPKLYCGQVTVDRRKIMVPAVTVLMVTVLVVTVLVVTMLVVIVLVVTMGTEGTVATAVIAVTVVTATLRKFQQILQLSS
jgi:hypothetical protein